MAQGFLEVSAVRMRGVGCLWACECWDPGRGRHGFGVFSSVDLSARGGQ